MTNRLAIASVVVTAAVPAVAGTAQASFPGANGKIVYLEQNRRGITPEQSLVAQSPRTRARTILREKWSPPVCWGNSPTYSPDGTKLAMQACDRLAILNADGSGFVQLPLFSRTERPSGLYYADDAAPGWSPDGKQLVFTSVSGYDDGFQPYENDVLAIRNVDGSDTWVLKGAYGGGANWSTRDLIAYSTGGNVPAIYTIRPDGSRPRLLLRRAGQPEWSPDGRHLAFVRGRWNGPNFRYFDLSIYVARENGKGVRRLVRGLYPAWSPNGRRLAFVQGTVRSGRVIWSLYTIRLDGTDRRLLVRTRDELIAPDWQPLH